MESSWGASLQLDGRGAAGLACAIPSGPIYGSAVGCSVSRGRGDPQVPNPPFPHSRSIVMSELDSALSRLRAHDGVEQLILLGRDGLVVRQIGASAGEDETLAARIPGLTTACEALGRAGERGRFLTSVLEFERGTVIVLTLAADLLLAVLLRPDVGFAPLLRELRSQRSQLIELL
jgi:predicted regulator of Ras-like GTPase activity (Roadblock/LC7/MglB family)